jgi:hypothetical protein
MVAIAITALALGGIMMGRKRGEYLQRARVFAMVEDEARGLVEVLRGVKESAEILARQEHLAIEEHRTEPDPFLRPPIPLADLHPEKYEARAKEAIRETASARRMIEYASMMRRKYERAARYPWLPAAPDPPRPD